MMLIDTLIEDQRWNDANLHAFAQAGFEATAATLGLDQNFEVSVLGCNDARIAALNADFRGKAMPTNVLSWPSEDLAATVPGAAPRLPGAGSTELGDIAISYDICAREAQAQDKLFEHHVTHLLVHGLLHLLGYDHETDEDAALMETFERRILAKLGIEDPYL